MTTAAVQSKLNDVELDVNQIQSRLNQLERQEWWRWSIAFVIMLALTFGLFALSMPITEARNWAEQTELNIGLRGLLALVLLFDVFVVYQQMLIMRTLSHH
jgi:cellobiose-specific phosphotransferase system component IIC